MMDKKGFLNTEVLRLPMFWVIVFAGWAASTAGYIMAKKAGWYSPMSNYIMFMVAIFFAAWYFLRNDA